MDEEVPVQPAAHDPAQKARERASEQDELRQREEEVVNRVASEALQHVMGGVAENLIDEYTAESIREKVWKYPGRKGGRGDGHEVTCRSIVTVGFALLESRDGARQVVAGQDSQSISTREAP